MEITGLKKSESSQVYTKIEIKKMFNYIKNRQNSTLK